MSDNCSSARRDAQRVLAGARIRVRSTAIPAADDIDRLIVNPALELLPAPEGVPAGVRGRSPHSGALETGFLIVWRLPHDGGIRLETARPADLLALKVIGEGIDPREAARSTGVAVGVIDHAIRHAVHRGVVLSPASRLRRPASFHATASAGEEFLSARVFTLQWHITQQCELACRHCYDRSERRAVALDEGIDILDQMREFCLDRFVRGQVSFSGGNPFLHPHFTSLYRAAVDRGLATAVIGNPVPRERLMEISEIQRPEYFQVSLEGREKHNDGIRGEGHFRRTLAFLSVLRELGIASEVMLTLTRDNLTEVLPLGELLRDVADASTFNRLAPFGAGASLALPESAEYTRFLGDYLAAMPHNPVLALKDSLCNPILRRQGRGVFDGCAGFGCGAAFNFVALLPDGEVHACRKFPSLIGNIGNEPLAAIYDGSRASAYREGSSACTECHLRPVCRGCPAVTAGLGGNPSTDRDPYCPELAVDG